MGNINLLIFILAAAILIWQAFLTFFFVRILGRYKKLVSLEKAEIERNLIGKLDKRMSFLEVNQLGSLQKVKLLRFNPFNETGGENSFTLSLLDGNLNGVILTGLHTREKTRMYVKEIQKGKSRFELSKEEKKLIQEVSK